MRHQVKGRKLGRSTPHRKATMKALSTALIKEHRIQTTLPKAKELRTYIEPVITRAKNDTTHNRRRVFAALQDKVAVTELFEIVIPEVGDRPGGYTRIVKLGHRLGDAADMAVIELVDFNDVKPDQKEKKKKRTRRAGKSNKPVSEEKGGETSADEEEVKAQADQAKAEKQTKAEEASQEKSSDEPPSEEEKGKNEN
jgi:large subunit ribosomal protein L17